MIMKKVLFLLALLPQIAFCQSFLAEGKNWTYYWTNGLYKANFKYVLSGDTIINGERCSKVYFTMEDQETGNTKANHSYAGALLEKGQQVFFVNESGKQLLYDFGLKVGDTISDGSAVVSAIDDIYLMGQTRRRLTLTATFSDPMIYPISYWVEGVGGYKGLLGDYWYSSMRLVFCSEGGRCVFTGLNIEDMPTKAVEQTEKSALLANGKVWQYHLATSGFDGLPGYLNLSVTGDTQIGDVKWRILSAVGADGKEFFRKLMREDGGKVYEYLNGHGQLVMDFSLEVGDRFVPAGIADRYLDVIAVDTLVSAGQAHRRLILLQTIGGVSTSLTSWVEGIGGDFGIISPVSWSDDDNPYQVAIDSPYPYSYQFDGCGFDGQCIYGQLLDNVSVGVAAPRVSTGQPAAAPLYDLQGRRVQQPMRHGVYIRGGKKVVR